MHENIQSCIRNIHKRQHVLTLLIAETYLSIFVTVPVDKEVFSGGFKQGEQNTYMARPAGGGFLQLM